MGIIRYTYLKDGNRKEFDTFLHMRDFAKNRMNDGIYYIHSPLRVCHYRRENVLDFYIEEEQKRELNAQGVKTEY